jgi:hypothetical protein
MNIIIMFGYVGLIVGITIFLLVLMMGNGFNCKVIEHILKHLDLEND